jgi:hypothetical protein
MADPGNAQRLWKVRPQRQALADMTGGQGQQGADAGGVEPLHGILW